MSRGCAIFLGKTLNLTVFKKRARISKLSSQLHKKSYYVVSEAVQYLFRFGHLCVRGVWMKFESTATEALTARWFVGQVRCQPALGSLDRLAFAFGVDRDLIFAKTTNGEVARACIREVETADAGRRGHRGIFG